MLELPFPYKTFQKIGIYCQYFLKRLRYIDNIFTIIIRLIRVRKRRGGIRSRERRDVPDSKFNMQQRTTFTSTVKFCETWSKMLVQRVGRDVVLVKFKNFSENRSL